MKKHKKGYKLELILSIILLIILVLIYVKSELNKGELISDSNKLESEISEDLSVGDNTVQDINGNIYPVVATLYISKLNIKYPVISEVTDEALKVSICKYWGPEPNEVGNFCIVGHNYRNSEFFSKIDTLADGDIIQLTDTKGRMINYKVYDKYTVEPDDVGCTSQLTDNKKKVTLITCTDDCEKRIVVNAIECE